MGAALDFRRDVLGGEDVLMQYIHELALWGGAHLAEHFGTELLNPGNMTGALINVRLPIPTFWPLSARDACSQTLYTQLVDEFNMRLVAFGTIRGSCTNCTWARISAQVYLERADFVRLGDAVLHIIKGCSAMEPIALRSRGLSQVPPE